MNKKEAAQIVINNPRLVEAILYIIERHGIGIPMSINDLRHELEKERITEMTDEEYRAWKEEIKLVKNN